MNCEQFIHRLQLRLDQRQGPESDSALLEHAGKCVRCAEKLSAWCQIESCLQDHPSAESQISHRIGRPAGQNRAVRFRSVAVVAAASAAILLFGIWLTPSGDESLAVRERVEQAKRPAEIQALAVNGDASTWLEDLSERDWVDKTMPTVINVRDGVAPLGRSLLQAVTILTGGGGTQNS